MPFGMVNSGSTYNRMVKIGGAQSAEHKTWRVMQMMSLDTDDWSEHINVLRNFFEVVRNANLSLRQMQNWL